MRYQKKLFILILLFLFGCSEATAAPVPAAPEATKQIVFKNTVVSLTFDDGDADNYEMREVLSKNSLHATFYIVSGFTGTNGYMTEQQLRDLYADGNEIGGHTLSHTKLTDVQGADLRREVCQDRMNLLAYGFAVTSFAYPYGHYNEESKQTVMDCGYNNARIVTGGPDTVPAGDAYALKAMPYIVQDTRLPKMLRYISQVEDAGGGWVIFVFHHVCAGCDAYSIEPEVFTEFAGWLGEQQANGLVVKTVGEVVGGEVRPGVAP
jgi:peptidoglycan/xylan/chitin deacetylase (PgdA/CDA1 family)